MLSIVPAVLFATAEVQSGRDPQATVNHLAAKLGASLGPPGGEVRALVRAPTEPDRLYVGTATGHVYVSHDGANSWQLLPVQLGHSTVVDNLLVDPVNAESVYAAYWAPDGTGGLLNSDDGGQSWRHLDVPGNPSLRAIAIAPSAGATLYVGGIGGVWRSDDRGESWRNVNGKGLATEFVESLAVDPRDPNHVYAGTWRQVYRSRDGGTNWRRVYQGMAVDRDIFSLAISPHDPDIVLAGTCNFLYCSNNAGGAWEERRTGLSTAHNRVHTIVHDPNDTQVVYAGTRGALYRSADAGTSWTLLVGGVSVSDVALSPDGKRIYVGTEERGVMVGAADETFVESNTGITSARVVAFDALPGAPRVLFAARVDGPLRSTIHYSTDVGQSWLPLGATPGVGAIALLRAQATPVNRLIVVAERGWWSVFPGGRWIPIPPAPGELATLEIAHGAGGAVLAATSEGLFLAQAAALADTTGGSSAFDEADDPTWLALWTGGPLDALTIENGEMLALGANAVVRGNIARLVAGQHPEISATVGLTEHPTGIALHPRDSLIAYAITRHDVFRSTDGGLAWSRLPLPWPATDLRSVAVDPSDPDQVLALDYRGAVYRGHGAGQHWLVLDADPGLHRAWSLRVSAQAPGFALVATQGHGLRVVDLAPLAATTGGRGASNEGSPRD